MKNQLQSNQAILPVKDENHIALIHSFYNIPLGKTLKLKNDGFISQLINSLRSYSDTPQPQKIPEEWTSVVVEFPNESTSTAGNKFCWFKKEHVVQINRYLEVFFNISLIVFLNDPGVTGRLGWEDLCWEDLTKMERIDVFIAGLSDQRSSSLYENLKKREYRKELIKKNRRRRNLYIKDVMFREKVFKLRERNSKLANLEFVKK